MNIRYIFLLTAGIAALAISSCKKNEEPTTPSLTGISIGGTTPPYLKAGTQLSFNAVTDYLATSDNTVPATVGLCWQVNNTKRDTLTRNIEKTNPTFYYTADTLGTYNVFCYAYAAGYLNSSTSVTFRVIDPDTALTGLKESGHVTLDGRDYIVVDLDGKRWMAENLYTEGRSLYDSDVLDSVVGNYYTWEEARQACPSGWHLPSGEEFDSLGYDATVLMADALFLGNSVWEYYPEVIITNEKGFNAIPGGYIDMAKGSSKDNAFREYGMWWTADEVDADRASFRYIYKSDPQVQSGAGSKTSLALSVRCVQD